jgi:hypothetical protein
MTDYTIDAKFTNLIMVGVTPTGVRLDAEFVGEVTSGPMVGAKFTGTDFLLLRQDGVGQVDVRARLTKGGSVIASEKYLGYLVPQGPLPDPAAMQSPDFTWPDGRIPVHGAAFWEAAAPEFAEFTRTVYGITGWVDLGARSLHVEGTSLAPNS